MDVETVEPGETAAKLPCDVIPAVQQFHAAIDQPGGPSDWFQPSTGCRIMSPVAAGPGKPGYSRPRGRSAYATMSLKADYRDKIMFWWKNDLGITPFAVVCRVVRRAAAGHAPVAL